MPIIFRLEAFAAILQAEATRGVWFSKLLHSVSVTGMICRQSRIRKFPFCLHGIHSFTRSIPWLLCPDRGLVLGLWM